MSLCFKALEWEYINGTMSRDAYPVIQLVNLNVTFLNKHLILLHYYYSMLQKIKIAPLILVL